MNNNYLEYFLRNHTHLKLEDAEREVERVTQKIAAEKASQQPKQGFCE